MLFITFPHCCLEKYVTKRTLASLFRTVSAGAKLSELQSRKLEWGPRKPASRKGSAKGPHLRMKTPINRCWGQSWRRTGSVPSLPRFSTLISKYPSLSAPGCTSLRVLTSVFSIYLLIFCHYIFALNLLSWNASTFPLYSSSSSSKPTPTTKLSMIIRCDFVFFWTKAHSVCATHLAMLVSPLRFSSSPENSRLLKSNLLE